MLRSACTKSAECMYAYLSYIAIRAVNAWISLYKERSVHVRLFIVHCYQSSKCFDQLVQRALSACMLIYRTLLSEQLRIGSACTKSAECMYTYLSYIAI